jgi:glucokinase
MGYSMPDYVLAIDIGGTRTRTALIDSNGRIAARASILTRPERGVDDSVERISAAVRQVWGKVPRRLIGGLGVGTPGAVDAQRGVILIAPNLTGWADVPLREQLQRALGLPTEVGNDANLAALAEHRFGAGIGARHMIYITISTGIGGGIIVDGRLLLGAQGFAGEIGHCTIDVDGPRCKCGNVGCLETLASGPALARAAQAALAAGEPSVMVALAGGRPEAISGETIAAAARSGDRLALQIIDQAGVYIGAGMVNLMHLFNPELFVLGGGVSNMGEPLFSAIRRTIEERALAMIRHGMRIVPAALGDDAGLLGAAALILQAREDHHG